MTEATETPAADMARRIADERGAVWGLAIRQNARLEGQRISVNQAGRAARRLARQMGWQRYTARGVLVRTVWAPPGTRARDVERLCGSPCRRAPRRRRR